MNYHQFQKQYRTERVILTSLFIVMMLVLGGKYTLNHPEIVANAYENPTEVFSSVIRGMAE